MKLISWGFIGCGEVTEKKSGPAFNEVEGSHVEAVMSRSESKARSYAERHNIPKWYTDAQELVDDPNVNAIYIVRDKKTGQKYMGVSVIGISEKGRHRSGKSSTTDER
jgi:hypothetical protein